MLTTEDDLLLGTLPLREDTASLLGYWRNHKKKPYRSSMIAGIREKVNKYGMMRDIGCKMKDE